MGIADELITRGWTQGWTEDSEGRVCLLGAAAYASGEYGNEVGNLWTMPPALVEILNDLCVMRFTVWNDAPERTFDEVLRVAKEADEILDRENT